MPQQLNEQSLILVGQSSSGFSLWFILQEWKAMKILICF